MGGDPKYGATTGGNEYEMGDEKEEIKLQGYGWILRNKLTGETVELLADYREDMEKKLEAYELIIFTWEEDDPEEREIQWE